MNKHHQQSSAPSAAIVIVVVLLIAVVLLAGCVLVGLMFYRNTTHKAMVAREHAVRAEAQARKAVEMERQRAEEMAREAEQRARAARRHVSNLNTSDATVSPKARLHVVEFRISVDAEGRMSVDGEALDWDQVNDNLEQLSNHLSSRVVIQADGQCRMEPVLKLLQAARKCSVEASIDTSHVEVD